MKSAVKAKMCGGLVEGTACRLGEVTPIRAASTSLETGRLRAVTLQPGRDFPRDLMVLLLKGTMALILKTLPMDARASEGAPVTYKCVDLPNL